MIDIVRTIPAKVRLVVLGLPVLDGCYLLHYCSVISSLINPATQIDMNV